MPQNQPKQRPRRRLSVRYCFQCIVCQDFVIIDQYANPPLGWRKRRYRTHSSTTDVCYCPEHKPKNENDGGVYIDCLTLPLGG